MIQAPHGSEDSQNSGRNKAPWWEKAAVIIGLGLLIANWYQSCQTKKAADAAQTAATTSKETMRIDQRAWINVVVGRAPLVIGQPLKPPIRIIDIGKTPAMNMRADIVVNLLGENEEPDLTYPEHGHPSYQVTVHALINGLPQDINDFAALPKYMTRGEPFRQVIVTDSVKKDFDKGASYLIVHGQIFYDDVFGVNHWIKFCSYAHNVVWPREQSVANTCGAYNDIDANK